MNHRPLFVAPLLRLGSLPGAPQPVSLVDTIPPARDVAWPGVTDLRWTRPTSKKAALIGPMGFQLAGLKYCDMFCGLPANTPLGRCSS
jgi:hypothetical protein